MRISYYSGEKKTHFLTWIEINFDILLAKRVKFTIHNSKYTHTHIHINARPALDPHLTNSLKVHKFVQFICKSISWFVDWLQFHDRKKYQTVQLETCMNLSFDFIFVKTQEKIIRWWVRQKNDHLHIYLFEEQTRHSMQYLMKNKWKWINLKIANKEIPLT